MMDLVRFFWQLALLQRKPQDLPGSAFLLQVLLVANLALSFLLGMLLYDSPVRVLLVALLELGLSAGLLFAGLQTLGKGERWGQSYSALLGLGIVGSLVTGAYHGLALLLGLSNATVFLDLLVFFWLLTAMGHVVRHSFSIQLPVALLLVFLYTMLLLGLVARWLPPDLAAG